MLSTFIVLHCSEIIIFIFPWAVDFGEMFQTLSYNQELLQESYLFNSLNGNEMQEAKIALGICFLNWLKRLANPSTALALSFQSKNKQSFCSSVRFFSELFSEAFVKNSFWSILKYSSFWFYLLSEVVLLTILNWQTALLIYPFIVLLDIKLNWMYHPHRYIDFETQQQQQQQTCAKPGSLSGNV